MGQLNHGANKTTIGWGFCCIIFFKRKKTFTALKPGLYYHPQLPHYVEDRGLSSSFSVQRVYEDCVGMSAVLPVYRAQYHCAGRTAIEAYLARILYRFEMDSASLKERPAIRSQEVEP
jgi:hypothetical protein